MESRSASPVAMTSTEAFSWRSSSRADERRIDTSSKSPGPQNDGSSCAVPFSAQDAHAVIRFPFLQCDEERNRDSGKGDDEARQRHGRKVGEQKCKQEALQRDPENPFGFTHGKQTVVGAVTTLPLEQDHEQDGECRGAKQYRGRRVLGLLPSA